MKNVQEILFIKKIQDKAKNPRSSIPVKNNFLYLNSRLNLKY